MWTKSLDTVILLINIVMTPALNAAGRGSSGIYMTANDYKNGTLAAEGRCDSRGHGLALHDVLHKPYIHVTHGSETKRYEKTDLFGFRSCKRRDFRFVENREFQILEAKALYIYLIKVPMPDAPGARHMWLQSQYHFSIGPDGPVMLLTLDNLRQVFPDNHRFHAGVAETFGSGEKLTQYDHIHQMFKVNWLLIASSEQ